MAQKEIGVALMATVQAMTLRNPGRPGFSRFWSPRICCFGVNGGWGSNEVKSGIRSKTFMRESFPSERHSPAIQILSRMKVFLKEGDSMPPPE